MILHTTLPQELIFAEGFQEKKEYVFSVDGIPALCEVLEGFEVRVLKLLSTDPNHFLQTRIVPGAVLSLKDWNGM